MGGVDLIAALDVGKTHTRLRLLKAESGHEIWCAKRVNESVETALGRQLDITGIERWLVEALSNAPGRAEINTLVPIGHGAAAVLIDREDRVLAAPDYEDSRFETVNETYESERDPFAETYSPSLPVGLNLGRQLFYLEQHAPEVLQNTAAILPYPQFWAWRFCEVAASEVTSFGCHSDLWRPRRHMFSSLARRHGWSERFPPARAASDVLGAARGPLARASGLPEKCRITCGIHDSNASYLRHLISRQRERFALISSGTWTVVMAQGGHLSRLNEKRDMLANVDFFGSAVPTARFMGGREYEAIARTNALPTVAAVQSVLATRAMAIPSFAAGGPYAGCRGKLLRAEGLDDAQRAALATLYVALMSDLALESLDASGDLIIDGPLASNHLFAAILAQLRPNSQVLIDDAKGVSVAIRYLAGCTDVQVASLQRQDPILRDVPLSEYRDAWRAQLPTTVTAL